MLRPIEIENSRILVLEWLLVSNIRTGWRRHVYHDTTKNKLQGF
jgi:hypothetical protein